MIEYLDKFPKILYEGRLMTDLTTRVDGVDSLISKEGVTFDYEMNFTEKPEDIAYNVYGNANYHWVVLLANKIQDPFYDWYLSDAEVLAKTIAKYGSDTAIHHYLLNGVRYRVDPVVAGTIPVTNYEYEEGLNSAKRYIRIIYPEFLHIIIEDFDRLVPS